MKQRAIILGLCVAVITFALSSAFSTTGTAIPDSVETFATEILTFPVNLFANGSVVFVTASDGASVGGLTIADVTDETFGDFILVELHDDGTGPGDNPNDGVYTGNFTIVDDLGTNAQFTDDITDTLDLVDGGVAAVVVDIDLQVDPGLASITADFSPPNVAINSGPDTVDLTYTLNVTITDPNMDTGNVWYNVDGGTDRRLTYQGGNDYEAQIDTSSLIDGPHTIGVVARDIVQNEDSTKTVTVTVAHPAPNVSITVTHTPVEPEDGDRVTFTVEIENTGDGDANDVSVSLIVDGTEVDTQIETIPAGGTSIIELNWTATEGPHDVEVQLTGTGVNVESHLEVFDIQPAPGDLLENPWFMAGLVILFIIAMIGGTIIYARTARDLARGTSAKPTPVEHVPSFPVGAKDPCEEIRRKWKAIQAEYERAKDEKESAGRRANELVKEADRAKAEEERASREAEQEHDALRHEVESLSERADAFRQRWRICMLKRLDEAVEWAESASMQAAEAAGKAQKAQDIEEYLKIKEEAQSAREKAGQAKEDSKRIKQKLDDEDLTEDTTRHDDRIERAERDASSAVKEIFALGAKFIQNQM